LKLKIVGAMNWLILLYQSKTETWCWTQIKELWVWELPRHEWSVLNRLRTVHGRCADVMFKWRLQVSPACDSGDHRLTINHIIKECQLRKFNQGIEGINAITPAALKWIRELDTCKLFTLHYITLYYKICYIYPYNLLISI